MPSGRTQKLSVLALAKPYFCCCEGFRMLWHFSDLAPSEAQVRDTPMSGYRTCRTPQVCIAQRSLAATASIARLALCIAAWSGAFSRDKLTRRANHFGFSEVLSSPGIKNISLSPPGKSGAHQLPSCPAKRGVGHRHGRGAGSGGRGCAFDERRGSVRRRRVVLTPRCWRQVGGKSRR
jgi:hypothetical protein